MRRETRGVLDAEARVFGLLSPCAAGRKRCIGLVRSTATAAYFCAGKWRQAAHRHHRVGPYRWRDWRIVGYGRPPRAVLLAPSRGAQELGGRARTTRPEWYRGTGDRLRPCNL